MEVTPYREGLGALMYLAVATRPDLSHAVQFLSRFMANPSYDHWNVSVATIVAVRPQRLGKEK